MSIILCVFILSGIVLTFVLKSKQENLNTLNKQNYEYSQQYQEAKDKSDYYFDEDGELSDEYSDDYYRYEEGYGNEGDKKIEIQES